MFFTQCELETVMYDSPLKCSLCTHLTAMHGCTSFLSVYCSQLSCPTSGCEKFPGSQAVLGEFRVPGVNHIVICPKARCRAIV